ncbi:MAG: hypothetical protein H6Q00_1230 [Holophagaceae bacterium]|nr:hypothetical protein [Holophagaceae bacterium]
MMHRVLAPLICLCMSAGTCAFAQDTLEGAKAMAIKAAAYLKQNGREGAKALNKPGNPFEKGALYVLVFDQDGTCLANPKAPGMAGQNLVNLKDPEGKLITKDQGTIAKKGGGWASYSWVNPATSKVQRKKAWIQPVEGTTLYTNCGLFQ